MTQAEEVDLRVRALNSAIDSFALDDTIHPTTQDFIERAEEFEKFLNPPPDAK